MASKLVRRYLLEAVRMQLLDMDRKKATIRSYRKGRNRKKTPKGDIWSTE